jgi:hypothetical protein
VKHAVTSSLHTLDKDFYARMQTLVSRWGKCLNVNGDYMETWYVLPATHVPCINRSTIQFSAWACSLLYFCNFEINHLKNGIASNNLKVSLVSLLVLLVRMPCRWQMTMNYRLNFTDKGNRRTRKKICISTTLPNTKPATNVVKMNLSSHLIYLLRPFPQKPGGSTSKEARWIPSTSYRIRY